MVHAVLGDVAEAGGFLRRIRPARLMPCVESAADHHRHTCFRGDGIVAVREEAGALSG